MGQAWCKEKTSKAQDSKSPLDRVFVRCAHRIYPGLKEEGSVLGGATQRVTSSEIGYAGSPPREVLTRGRSIDSVDRPFHPSDWVDVNLEVPSTPRASSVLTNLTVDTSLYPATTPTSSCSNLKDVTPVPPPRRKKRNKGRPLPPKPDEIPENSAGNLKHGDGNEEPLYSSVKSPKTSGDEQDAEEEARTDKSCSNTGDTKHEGRRTKEVYEHKVNGTGKIISSDVVSGRTTSTAEDKKTCRNSEATQHSRKGQENEEYERFARNQLVKDSSTPNRQDGRKSKDLEKQIKDSSRDVENSGVNVRTKNYSTVSLPNYDELDVARHQTRRTKDGGGGGEKTKSRRPVRSSTGSLPAESFLSPFSEKTSVRLEDYIPRRGSTDILSPYQVLGKLDCSENGVVDGGFAKYDPSKLEDWDLGDVGNCELNHHRRLSFESSLMPQKINVEKRFCESGDVVDFAPSSETGDREGRSSAERETSGGNVTGMSALLQKPETFGKTPSSAPKEMEDSRVGQNRSQSRYFDPPTLAGTCGASPTSESTFPPVSREPFYLDETKHRSALDTIGGSCRNGAAISEESDRSDQSRMIFGRSLSNESEPSEDAYEAKELRGHRDVTSKLIRTISEESLPREMVEGQDGLDEFFEEKLAKDARYKTGMGPVEEKVRTPPPSPEPRIKAEIQDNDHSTLLKVLKEEAADESNLSSMTPSLTELEAALSDMLEKEEKEDTREEIGKEQDKAVGGKTPSQESRYTSKFVEPDIVPVEKNPASFKGENVATRRSTATIETQGRTSDKILVDEDLEESIDEVSVSLGQILEERKGPIAKGRKVSFCAWEETSMAEIDLRNDREFIGRTADLDNRTVSDPMDDRMAGGGLELEKVVERISASPVVATSDDNTNYVACSTDFPPEKPSRLHRNPDDSTEHTEASVPTPPRRKHKGRDFLFAKAEIETAQNGSTNYKQIIDPYHNDRLI